MHSNSAVKRNMRKAFSLEQKGKEDAEGEPCTKNDGITSAGVAGAFTRCDGDKTLPWVGYKHAQDGIKQQSVLGARLALDLVSGHFNT